MIASWPHNGIANIDHPVIASADLDAARAAFERLGFTVPPRGSHIEWGTGNLCIMFPEDYIEVRGGVDATGAADIVATRLERDDPDDEVELRGFVESVDAVAGSLVILGITVTIQPGNVGHQAFLDIVSAGDLVEVEGTLLADGVIAADELEIEDD